MRKTASRSISLILLLAALAAPLAAQVEPGKAKAERPGDLAVGAGAGNLSGLSAKWWLDDQLAVELGLGSLSLGEVTASAGLLVHRFGLFQSERDDLTWRVPLYWGGSVMVVSNTQESDPAKILHGGAKAVLGLAYMFPEPFELFVEAGPACVVYDKPAFGFLGCVGARYYLDGAAKPAAKPAVKAADKPEAKPEAKPEPKPAPAPEPATLQAEDEPKPATRGVAGKGE